MKIKDLHPEDGGSVAFRNVDILPHHYKKSQLRRPPYLTISLILLTS